MTGTCCIANGDSIKRVAIKRTDRSKRRKKLGLHDPAYMAWVATQACIVCGRKPVEVAHVGLRGLGQKCSDRETLPICTLHHRSGKESQHELGKRFWPMHSLDKQALIEKHNALYDEHLAGN